MQFEPEVNYLITSGEPIHQWLVASGMLKAPIFAKKTYDFFVEIPHDGALLQTVVAIDINCVNMSWHSSVVEWLGRVIRAGEIKFESLHARGTYDLEAKHGSITFEPDPVFAEIAATSLW